MLWDRRERGSRDGGIIQGILSGRRNFDNRVYDGVMEMLEDFERSRLTIVMATSKA